MCDLLLVDATCIDTLLKGGEELTNFQGHSATLKCQKYGFCVLSSEPVDGL